MGKFGESSVKGFLHTEGTKNCQRRKERLYPKKRKKKRNPKAERQDQTSGNTVHLGQADTAMYQASHGTSLRSKIQQ